MNTTKGVDLLLIETISHGFCTLYSTVSERFRNKNEKVLKGKDSTIDARMQTHI